jgi:hypothetical protein
MVHGRNKIQVCVILLPAALLVLSACSKVSLVNETAYVVPEKLRVRSAVAEAALTVGELSGGDKVTVSDLAKSEDGSKWSKINGPNGQSGWVKTESLVKETIVEQSRKIAQELDGIPAQAIGKSKASLKLRLSADRTGDDNVATLLPSGTTLEIIARDRKPRPSNLPTAPPSLQASQGKGPDKSSGEAAAIRYDEWFKVRVKDYAVLPAGWIYGGSIDLDIPGEILYFASTDRKIVGWQKIATLKGDDSKSGDHFLVLERKLFKADDRVDFDRVKVLAYDPSTRNYGTPFRDEVLGRFPLLLKMEGTRGSFQITALDQAGQPQQRDYTVEMLGGGKLKVTKPLKK